MTHRRPTSLNPKIIDTAEHKFSFRASECQEDERAFSSAHLGLFLVGSMGHGCSIPRGPILLRFHFVRRPSRHDGYGDTSTRRRSVCLRASKVRAHCRTRQLAVGKRHVHHHELTVHPARNAAHSRSGPGGQCKADRFVRRGQS